MLPGALRAQDVRGPSELAQVPVLPAAIASATAILKELRGINGNGEAREALSQQIVKAVDLIKVFVDVYDGYPPIDVPEEGLLSIAPLTKALAQTHESLRQQTRGGPLTKLLRSGPDADMLNAARQNIQCAVESCLRSQQQGATYRIQLAQKTILKLTSPLAFAQLPPNPHLFMGRQDVMRCAIDIIADSPGAHFAIMGAPGIGKTALALAVVHADRTLDRYEERRFFIDCGSHWNIPHLLASCGMATVKELVLYLRSMALPSLLVLDGFDTLLYRNGTAAVSLIDSLGGVDCLTLLLTMRGTEISNSTTSFKRIVLGPLGPHASEELVTRLRADRSFEQLSSYLFSSTTVDVPSSSDLSTCSSLTSVVSESADVPVFGSDDVHKIVVQADGVPLALTLLVHNQMGHRTAPASTESKRGQARLHAILGGSIAHLDTTGAETLALLARAPSGLKRFLLPVRGVTSLLRAALAYRQLGEEALEERIYVLAPIREYALVHFPLSQEGLAHLQQLQHDDPNLPLLLDPPDAEQSTTATFYTAPSVLSGGRSLQSVATAFWTIQDIAVVPEIKDAGDLRDHFEELDVTNEITSISLRPRGFGGSSDVMKAELHNCSVAIKVPRVTGADASLLNRIAREIAIWRTLSHRNILPLSGLYWSATGLPAMVSPWCSNGHVTSYIASLRACSLSSNIALVQMQMLEGTLSGLTYLHGIGTVHGDLKGANIMVTDDGVACIADFGVSAVLTEYPPRSADGCGTFRWMAPELLQPRPVLTSASDIWAYGCVMIEVVTGQHPFHDVAEEIQVILRLHKGATPPRPIGIPDELWRLCELCFTRNSFRRPRAERLLADLQELID